MQGCKDGINDNAKIIAGIVILTDLAPHSSIFSVVTVSRKGSELTVSETGLISSAHNIAVVYHTISRTKFLCAKHSHI